MKPGAWRGWLVGLSLCSAACSAILGFDGDVIDPSFPPAQGPDEDAAQSSDGDATVTSDG